MTKRSTQSTVDVSFTPQSKKERIDGVRPLTSQGKPASTPLLGGLRIEESMTIGRPVAEVYAFWRDFTNLPEFCKHLRAVTVRDTSHSHWIANGPGDQPLVWDAVLIEDIPNELISWRTEKGSALENAGSVRFREAPGNRGTEITVTFAYNPPAGPLGSLIAKLSAKDPVYLLKEQLRRLKQLLETGEIATTDGQPAVLDS